LIPGIWYGTLVRINQILKYLRDPEKAKADLSSSIAALKGSPKGGAST